MKAKEVLFLPWIRLNIYNPWSQHVHFENTIEHSVFILFNSLKQLQVLCVISYTVYLFQSQEELQEYCRHHEITYVALVSDKEGSHVKVKTGENLSQFSRFPKLC